MDIAAGSGYPASALSNFAPHPFVLDGVQCNSLEGFLQSLKFENQEMQKQVCLLVGRAAKFKGKPKKWWRTGKLHWQGVELDRFGAAYQALLDEAYWECFSQNDSFRRALLATGDAVLTHSIGNTDPHRTVLTRKEFTQRLTALRAAAREARSER